MNQNFNIQRIVQLLRYDFIPMRRTLLMAAGCIVGLYLLCVYQNFTGEVRYNAAAAVSMMCHGIFSVAFYVGLILATLLLHRKFTNPSSAPLYITLPASSAEKFTVLLLDYVGVLLGIRILEFLCYSASMGIGVLVAPDVNWTLSFFDHGENAEALFRDIFVNSLRHDYSAAGIGIESALTATYVCTWSIWTATLLYFVCLNFHFKRNGILKSCLMMLLTYIVIFCIVVPIGGYFLMNYVNQVYALDDEAFSNQAVPTVVGALRTLEVLMWCTPIIPLLTGWRLYRLVARKQIK